MILDRNICSDCGEKNFRDKDYMHSNGVCKECYNKAISESDAVKLYKSLLIYIENPFDNNDFILKLTMAFFFFIPFTFEYEDWWFLKGVGVIFAFGILIATPIEVFFKPLISSEPKILQNKKFDITVDKEVYEDFKPFDIYKEYFISSKKDNNIFYVLKIEDIKKYKGDIETAYNNRRFAPKLFVISIVWTIIITILVHLLSGSSIYINNTKPLDLKDKNNWIEVSQKSCEDLGGVFSKEENECRTKWVDAKKICRANDARLATFDEYEYANLFTLTRTNAQWTNTSIGDFKHLFYNATLGRYLDYGRPRERFADRALTNEVSSIGKALAQPTDKKLIVKCVKGTSNYYLRNFDTK
jgi:hypothetical protein